MSKKFDRKAVFGQFAVPAPQQAADLARKAPDGLAGGAGIVVPTASTPAHSNLFPAI